MVTVEFAFKDFLVAKQADGLSPVSVHNYQLILTPMINHLENEPINCVTVNHLREYVVLLRTRTHRYGNKNRPAMKGGLSHESLRTHIRAMKVFFNWCVLEYALEVNPATKIRVPARIPQEPKAIALDDLTKLLQACNLNESWGIRSMAILCFLCDTGCRAGGLLSLRFDNLYLTNLYAVVLEKGSKPRRVPFTEYTAEMLAHWLTVRPDTEKHNSIFCSLNKPYSAMTYSGLEYVLKRLAKEAQVTGRINPHSFRHGFAQQFLLNGGDLATLSHLMGHRNVTLTVEYYARFQHDQLAKQHQKFSPIHNVTGRK
jgi:site-specific recombinase XerD